MEKFGKFALAMVPGEIVLESWMEKINNAEFIAFLGLISQFNKNVGVLERYEFVLDRMLMGQPPPVEFCKLESTTAEEDIQGLDDDNRFTLLEFDNE
jgi:hypothetical protein